MSVAPRSTHRILVECAVMECYILKDVGWHSLRPRLFYFTWNLNQTFKICAKCIIVVEVVVACTWLAVCGYPSLGSWGFWSVSSQCWCSKITLNRSSPLSSTFSSYYIDLTLDSEWMRTISTLCHDIMQVSFTCLWHCFDAVVFCLVPAFLCLRIVVQ